MLHGSVQRLLRPALRYSLTAKFTVPHRTYEAFIAGPPRYPVSTLDMLLLGGGFITAISLVPMWGVGQVPKWSQIHNST